MKKKQTHQLQVHNYHSSIILLKVEEELKKRYIFDFLLLDIKIKIIHVSREHQNSKTTS